MLSVCGPNVSFYEYGSFKSGNGSQALVLLVLVVSPKAFRFATDRY